MRVSKSIILLIITVLYIGCKKQPVYNTVNQINIDINNLCEDANEFFES